MSAIQMAVLLMVSGSSGFTFNATISADTQNYNLRSAALAGGWDGVAPLNATVTINSGIAVTANATSQYAFDTGASFPAGSSLNIVNNGYIIGMGGAGGNGGAAGAAGGPALRAQAAVTVTNNGTIGGGGGGGGGGATYDYELDGELGGGGGGGGGRSGRTNSPGGLCTADQNGQNGGEGTFTAAGAGGNGGATYDYYEFPSLKGGNGGDWGTAGAAGVQGGDGNRGLGGAAGAAVVGNANITWAATGTRLGALT